MRKVRVWRASLAFPLPNPWYVEVDGEGQCGGIWCATHTEAMFLAQLLADPPEVPARVEEGEKP